MILPNRSASAPEARIFGRRIVLLILVFLFLGALFAFRGAGRWLIREDPLAKADIIFVLSGRMPFRAEEAARIYRMGLAPEIWVSRPDNPGTDLQELGIHYVGEEEYNRDVLIREGVPEAAIHILPEMIENTEEEVRGISGVMSRAQKHSVIIVTSPEHTRRVRRLWLELVGKRPAAIVRAAWQDKFDAGHWWRNTQDILSVTREILGLLNVWLGLPVKPHSR